MCSFVHHAKSDSKSNGIENSKNVRNKSFMLLENNKIMVKKTHLKSISIWVKSLKKKTKQKTALQFFKTFGFVKDINKKNKQIQLKECF